MTQFFKDNLTFSSLAEMLDLPQAEKMEMQKKIASWNLAPWEDILVNQLSPLSSAQGFNAAKYDRLISVIRRDAASSAALSAQEIDTLKFEEFNKKPNAKDIICRTVYYIINFGNSNLAMALIKKFTEQSSAGANFFNFSDEDLLFYKKIYLILACNFFDYLEEAQQFLLLNGDLLCLALQMGFDFEEIIANYLQETPSLFEVRNKKCLNFMSALADNGTVVGPPNEQELFSVYYWIGLFRTFSQNRMTEQKLKDFIEGKKFFTMISDADRYLVSVILSLYTRLADESLMGLDMENIENFKPDITSDITYAIFNRELTENDKQQIREWFSQVSGEQVSAYISTVIDLQGVDYKNEPVLSNLLSVSDMYIDFYKINEPLIYFDEDKKDFILRKLEIITS